LALQRTRITTMSITTTVKTDHHRRTLTSGVELGQAMVVAASTMAGDLMVVVTGAVVVVSK
jgi:hypothetical protein